MLLWIEQIPINLVAETVPLWKQGRSPKLAVVADSSPVSRSLAPEMGLLSFSSDSRIPCDAATSR
jgi:hypothetical protein